MEEDAGIDEEKSVRVKQIDSMIMNLGNVAKKMSILDCCREFFHNPKFIESLNKDRYLIGFKNGVYDLKQNVLRDGRPADLITKYMTIEYKEYADDHPLMKEVHEFFQKVFPNPLVRRYFFDISSELFVGYNHRKHVYFWTGEGNNGKSITEMIFCKLFGPLAAKTPTTLITSKKSGIGSTTSETSRLGDGVRLTFLEEPDPEEEIYQGTFKHLSGNDTYYTREVFQVGREIEPMFRIVVVCNELPTIKRGGDKATWDRVRVFPFQSTFEKAPPDTIEEQWRLKRFPVDTTLESRIPHWAEPFCYFLMMHTMKPKIEDPPEVLAATKLYETSCDVIAYFLSEHMVKDETSEVSIGGMYEFYKESGRSSNLKCIDLIGFDKNIRKRFGETTGQTSSSWKGYKMIGKKRADTENNEEQPKECAPPPMVEKMKYFAAPPVATVPIVPEKFNREEMKEEKLELDENGKPIKWNPL